MTRDEALKLAKSEGALYIHQMPNGSFTAYRQSRVDITSEFIVGVIPHTSWKQTIFPRSFIYASRHFSHQGAGFYTSPESAWLHCREMHADVQEL